MIKDLSGDQDKLIQWIAAVDHDCQRCVRSPSGCAVTSLPSPPGLTQQYSSGAVPGTVNKIKARKMQLFGRAKHDLLR